MRHAVLPATAATVSVGETNRDYGVTFQWLEPTTEPTWEVFSSLSLGGHQTVQGMHELWPERSDQDAIVRMKLDHCLTANCDCGKPKMNDLLKQLMQRHGLPGAVVSGSSADAPVIVAEAIVGAAIAEAHAAAAEHVQHIPAPVPEQHVDAPPSGHATPRRQQSKTTAPASFDPNTEADNKRQLELLQDLRSGKNGH